MARAIRNLIRMDKISNEILKSVYIHGQCIVMDKNLLLPVKCISQGHNRTVKNFKTSMKEGSLYTRLKAG